MQGGRQVEKTTMSDGVPSFFIKTLQEGNTTSAAGTFSKKKSKTQSYSY